MPTMARADLLLGSALLICCTTLVVAEVKNYELGNVAFLDGGKQGYLRSKTSDSFALENKFTREEIAAAVAVLLGGLPPDSLSSKSSVKLDALLSPNLFNRPRAVFMLDVGGISADSIQALAENAFGSSLQFRSILGNSDQQPFELPGESVTLKSLDEWGYGHDMEKLGVSLVLEKLEPLVSFLKGSYRSGQQVGSVFLNIPVPDAADFSLALDLTKTADLSFVVDLISLVSSTQDLASTFPIAQEFQRAILFRGTFKALELFEEKSSKHMDATKLFLYTTGRVLDHMKETFSDQLVGVYTFAPNSLERPIVTVSHSKFARVLVEDALAPSPSSSANRSVYDADVKKLNSRTITVTTAIILIISTILGSFFLFGMRVTRDTLLYANVKLD